MLQIYAPGEYGEEGQVDESFHRTIYIFVCSSNNACNGEAVAIRQQLPEKNSYYPENPPDYEVQFNFVHIWEFYVKNLNLYSENFK